MLLEEAKWLGKELLQLTKQLDRIPRLLNVGSGTNEKTENVQSHQNEYVLSLLKKENIETVNTDIETGEGVDIVGDLTNPEFLQYLKNQGFNIVTCNNLLEHVDPVEPICSSFKSIIPFNGYLVVTVPYRYPYHPDPIDTMLRPNVKDLQNMIEGFNVIKGEIINGTRSVRGANGRVLVEHNYFQTLMNNKRHALKLVLISFLPFYKFSTWWNTVRYWPYLFTSYKVTCVVMQRQ